MSHRIGVKKHIWREAQTDTQKESEDIEGRTNGFLGKLLNLKRKTYILYIYNIEHIARHSLSPTCSERTHLRKGKSRESVSVREKERAREGEREEKKERKTRSERMRRSMLEESH